MSVETRSDSPVSVDRFARVFVKGPEELPSGADTYYDPDQGYYFKLHLDGVTADEATPMISKARERFDVELVRRVTQDGFFKERVYVDNPSEVPDDKKVQQGPSGGVYYETGVQSVGVADQSESRNVAVIHWDDVELGDEIVFETPDGKETFANIVDIEERVDSADIIHVEHDGETYRAEAGSYSVQNGDAKSVNPQSEIQLSEGSLTSGSDGASSARYSPEEDEEEDIGVGTPAVAEKDCDGHHVGPYTNGVSVRLEDGEVQCEESGEVYDLNADIESAEPMGECPGCGEDLGDLVKADSLPIYEFEKNDQWVYHVGPQGGEGWLNVATGEKRYQKQRPGQAPEGGDGYGDWLGDGWEEPPEDLTELQAGQIVEFQDPNGEYHEGEIDIIDPEGEYVKVQGDDTNALIGPAGEDDLTAVEEIEMPTMYEEGDPVHILTDDIPSDHPDYMDEEGVISDVVAIGGDPYYEVSEPDGGPVIMEYGEDELLDLDVMDEAVDEVDEDLEDEAESILDEMESEFEDLGSDDEDSPPTVEDLNQGDNVLVDWDEVDYPVDSSVEEAADGTPGVKIEEGMMEGAWVNADDIEVIAEDPDNAEGSDGDGMLEAEVGDTVEVQSQSGTFEAEVIQQDNNDYVVEDESGSEFVVYGEDIVDVNPSDGSDDSGGFADMLDEETDEVTPEEQEYLDEHDIEVGTSFHHHGMESIVTGATSMMQDGEPSHVEVFVPESDTTVPLHPNAVPDDATADTEPSESEGEGTGPSEDEASSAVAEPASEGMEDMPLDQADPESFVSAVEEFAEENPDLEPMLSFHDPEEFEDADVFLSESGDSGVAVNSEGDIQNVFSKKGADIDGDQVMEQAIEAGGETLDCYDGFLTDFYQSHGFDVTGTMDFNPEFAPDGWEENPHLRDEPDVMFMAHNTEGIDEVPKYDGSEFSEAKTESQRAANTGSDDRAEGGGVGGGERGDDAGAGEDGRDGSVGYDLSSYSPDDADEFRDMSDIGASHGNSVSAMEVAVMPDGSKAVHKDIGHHTVSEDDIKRETAGYEAAKHLTDNVPVHVADMDAGWSASEVVPGVDAKDATPEMKEAVDRADFVDMAAKQVMIGNSDLHQNNVRVDENGELYPFDLDRAAGDLTGDWVGHLSQYDDTLDRILGELESSATALGFETGQELRESIIQRAEEVAGDVDTETLNEIHSDVGEIDSDFAETIRMNIDRLSNGEISL